MEDKAQRWILAISIAIVFNLFINFGIATVYESPKYDDFCKLEARPLIKVADNCTEPEVSQSLADSCRNSEGYISYKYDSKGCATESYCETCQNDYRDASSSYNNIVFIILSTIGAVSLLAGLTTKRKGLAVGFALAGILSIIIGAIRNFEGLNNLGRFILTGLILAALIWFGNRKIK